jgi:hypothetical protein
LTVGLYGLTSGLLLAHRRASAWPRRSRLLVQGGLALAVALDLALAARQLKTQNRDSIERPSEAAIARGLVAEGSLGPGLPPPRVSIPKPWARENAGMLQGWSSFTGYEALQLERVWHHLHAFLGLPLPQLITTYPDGAIFRQGAFPFPDMGLTLGFDPVTIRPVFRATPDPRAYLVFAGRKVADHREATLRMREGHDFHRVALVEDAAYTLASAQEGGALSGRVALVHFAANRLELDVDSPASALLVVAEAWFPGWHATVNGDQADCIPANAWMRAIPVPAGHSRVALRYFPRHLVAGAVISLLAALLVSGLLWRHRGRTVGADAVNRGS